MDTSDIYYKMVKSVEDTNLSSTAGNPFKYYEFRNFSGSGGYFAKKILKVMARKEQVIAKRLP